MNQAIPDALLLSEYLLSTPDHVYFKDVRSRFLWVSASLARSLNCTVSDVVGRTDAEFFDAEKARCYREAEVRIMTTGEPRIDCVVEHSWPDGNHTWCLNVTMPMRDAYGEVVGIWGSNKDITEKILMERALERSNEELAAQTQRANEMTERAVRESQGKSGFLAVVSHEIRNPLNAVMGCADLLKDTPLDPTQRDYVETIDDSSRAALALIKDLLDHAKIEAGGLELEQLEINLPDVLEDAVRLISMQARVKGLEVVLDIDPAVPEVIQGDPTRLGQILLNLGSNAVKFTEHGDVRISVSVVETMSQSVRLRFEVQDAGIGIPADRLEAVFEPYTQADRSTTRRFGGTGLGLPIVKRIVALMGGKTGVLSTLGSGSTFWFTAQFPVIERVTTIDKPARPVLKGRVLVVDDNATQRKVLGQQLQQCGLEVVNASSGHEALAILRQAYNDERAFDVALLDHQMPAEDGAELGRTISCDTRLRSTRLVLLTASRQRLEAFGEMGFTAVLNKPATRRDLIDALLLVLTGQADDWRHHTSTVITQRLLNVHRGRDQRHILVAEDIPAGRKVACRTLERLGYQATGVANGHEAIAAWESRRFHLILMDCEMPELDGFEATREIRRRESSGEHIPIVALTGRAMNGAASECRAAGMDNYLVKPFDRARLEACLDRILGCDFIDITGERPGLPNAASIDSNSEDSNVLRTLADGDEQFMKELVDDFVQQAHKVILDFSDAIAKHDAVALASAAHALKTSAGVLQAKELLASAERLENAARAGALDEDLTEHVRMNLNVTMERLRRWSA